MTTSISTNHARRCTAPAVPGFRVEWTGRIAVYIADKPKAQK